MSRNDFDRALAFIVAGIRTSHGFTPWQEPGIVAALAKLHDRPPEDVAVAAIYAAATRPDQRTPAVIAAHGSHWRDAPQHQPTAQPPRIEPEPFEPLPPDLTAQRARQAREAIHPTTIPGRTNP